MSGTLFDDIIVTDSVDEAFAFAEETFFKRKDAEKKMKDDKDAEKAASSAADMDMGADLDDEDDDFDAGMGDEF